MTRFLSSLLAGWVIGAVIGVLLGWGPFSVEYLDNPAANLSQRYQDEYTVMVAGGYLVDHDPLAAVERLRVLGVPNVADHVWEVAERYITYSRDVEDIRKLVALLEALIGTDRLPDLMRPYRIEDEQNTP